MIARFAPPSEDEALYAKALSILSTPARRVRTVGTLAAALINAILFLGVCAIVGLVAEQVWDRSQLPFDYIDEWADPHVIASGDSVKVWVRIIRHKRCHYAVSWSVTDSRSMVTYFGPVQQEAPGDPSPLPQAPLGANWQTPPVMAPGPATIRISLRGDCPGNWIDNYWPVTVDMPPVHFTVADLTHAHDTAPGARP